MASGCCCKALGLCLGVYNLLLVWVEVVCGNFTLRSALCCQHRRRQSLRPDVVHDPLWGYL